MANTENAEIKKFPRFFTSEFPEHQDFYFKFNGPGFDGEFYMVNCEPEATEFEFEYVSSQSYYIEITAEEAEQILNGGGK